MNWDVRRFDTIDSTNTYLLDEARSGAPAGLVAAAGHQTAGRGRRGRVWDSKPGASLLVSALFRPKSPEFLIRYPQAAALAILDAANLAAGVKAQLKWPNDVVVAAPGGELRVRKLAGVLVETATGDENDLVVVVGCGINLNWAGEMSESLREVAVSADEIAGHPVDATQFLDAMLSAFSERLARPTWVSESYRQRCITLGRNVRIEQEGAAEPILGVAESITDEGALVVRTSDGTREVTVGDVVHVR